jgi:hypothetical protein
MSFERDEEIENEYQFMPPNSIERILAYNIHILVVVVVVFVYVSLEFWKMRISLSKDGELYFFYWIFCNLCVVFF